MTSRDRVVTLPPGAKTRDSHKAVLGHLKDKDETPQPLPFPGSAHGLHDQGGSRDAFDTQRASLAPGTQPPWFGGAPWSAGEKWPADAYFPSLATEFFESDGEPEATRSLAESSVRSSWQAQAAPVLAGRTDAIPVASTADPSAVADHSPPSAAVETAAGSNAAARKVGKRPVLVPLGSGGIARWGRSNPISFLRIPKVIKSTLSLESLEHVPWRKLGHVGRDWRFINNYTNGSLVSATSQDHRSGQPGYQSRI